MFEDTVTINPERVLINAGALEPCRENTDLCPTSEFQEDWRESINTVRTSDPGEEHIAGALNARPEDSAVTFNNHQEAIVAYTEDGVVGQWSSHVAVIADVAAASELAERSPVWSDLSPTEIARVLMSLRIFIERCPECDGSVQVGEEVVESCCRSYDVVASVCQDCDARLFEIEWNNDVTEDSKTQPIRAQASN